MKLTQSVCILAAALMAAASARSATLLDVERAVLASTFVDVSPVFTDDDVVGFGSAAPGVDESAAHSFAIALTAELAELSIVSGFGPVDGSFSAYARLIGAATGVHVDWRIEDSLADGAAVAQSQAFSGVLAPEPVALEIGASGFSRGFEDAVGFGTAGFGFQFLALSEPSAAALFGLALALVAVRYWPRGRGGRT
jgi:hypothetical protein